MGLCHVSHPWTPKRCHRLSDSHERHVNHSDSLILKTSAILGASSLGGSFSPSSHLSITFSVTSSVAATAFLDSFRLSRNSRMYMPKKLGRGFFVVSISLIFCRLDLSVFFL